MNSVCSYTDFRLYETVAKLVCRERENVMLQSYGGVLRSAFYMYADFSLYKTTTQQAHVQREQEKLEEVDLRSKRLKWCW